MSDGGDLAFLAEVDDIPAAGLAFSYPAGGTDAPGLLIRTAGGVRAFRNVCRHLQVRLDHGDPGRFFTSDRRFLACSQHGALYRPDDGACVAGPCMGAALRQLPIRVIAGRVFLETGANPEPVSGGPTSP